MNPANTGPASQKAKRTPGAGMPQDSAEAQGSSAPEQGGTSYSGSLQARGGAQGQVSGRTAGQQGSEGPAMRPPVDIFEDESGVTLLADMPGVAREGLEVRVDGETLLIEGRAEVPEVGEMELIHSEMLSPVYRRSFSLSRDLDPQNIEAELKDGVLRLRLHKAEQAKPRRIEVRAG
jgi:HSP20 family protein